MRRGLLIILLVFFIGSIFFAGNDSLRTRKALVGISASLFGSGTLLALNQAWYAEYNTGRFHFFNDNNEWLQMDKAGHVFSTYQSARLLMDVCDWASFKSNVKYGLGAGAGFVFMTGIEIMDGYSRGWGYSWGDQLANGLGASLALFQEMQWKEQRIQMKFSFARSGLAPYNPRLLGKTLNEQILKDYNGQTYWLSINPAAFFTKKKSFLNALSLAIGYGGRGMLGGEDNNRAALQPDGTLIVAQRERVYFLSLDLDLRQLPLRSAFWRSLLSVVQIVKIPAPALQFSRQGVRGYGLYF